MTTTGEQADSDRTAGTAEEARSRQEADAKAALEAQRRAWKAESDAFLALRVEAAIDGAAVIAAYFRMGEEAFVKHAKFAYGNALVNLTMRAREYRLNAEAAAVPPDIAVVAPAAAPEPRSPDVAAEDGPLVPRAGGEPQA